LSEIDFDDSTMRVLDTAYVYCESRPWRAVSGEYLHFVVMVSMVNAVAYDYRTCVKELLMRLLELGDSVREGRE
jgi:uncharacterized protein YmfQ (DUF2313 family)